jgi:hypothetical protein
VIGTTFGHKVVLEIAKQQGCIVHDA